MNKNKTHHLTKIFIFFPILFYFGKRSLIAYDEGFYALQARWIIENNNWIDPTWWGDITLDRTIGIQALIAFSKKIFGNYEFAISIPSTLAAILMLIITYKLHKELLDNKFPIISPLILSTSYLWINYSHMASQDIFFSSMVTLGIYCSIKSNDQKNNLFIFLSGFWIGIAFMLKTYLTLVPLISLAPYLFVSKIFFKKYFWIGSLLGFLPFFLWSYQIIKIHGFEVYEGLYLKVLNLSNQNNFSNPIYYYLWNLPINIFPWTIFSIIGYITNFKNKYWVKRYFLIIFPSIIIGILSIFSTKTPYYPIQILPILSINAYVGLNYILSSNKKIVEYVKKFHFIFIPLILTIIVFTLNTNLIIENLTIFQKTIIIISISAFSISWICFNFTTSFKKRIFLIILGPYLLVSIAVQSGTFTDRSKDLRINMENLIKEEKLIDKKIEIVIKEAKGNSAHSKIIKIALETPILGKGISDINELRKNNYGWTTLRSEMINADKFEIISDSDIFKPWKLTKRK